MRRFVPVIALTALGLSAFSAFAYRDQAVLGTSTQASEAVFPAVTAGPGHILPDSPFYFADKMYQTFRLALVFTPENRAQLHTEIAAERLAELRVEASRNNKVAVDTALSELEHESLAAANDLRDASSQGKDVTQLARNIHQALTDYRGVLTDVQSQVPDTSFEQKLAAAADVLREARVVAEDAMPQSDIDHEIAANINSEVDEAVLGVATTTTKLEKKLNIYEQFASKAAEQTLKKQQEEAKRASLSAQQKAINAQKEKAIKEYLVKIEALRKQREAELMQLKKTIKDLQDQLKQTQNANLSTSNTTQKITPTITPKITK